MNPSRWRQIKTVFRGALELEADDRRSYVEEQCALDEELRRRVESLLAAHADSGEFLNAPAASLDAFDDLVDGGSRASEVIGPYRLVRKLGSGGMGEVYLAQRADAEFDQQVAIKLIRNDRGSAELVKRFKTERQILAGLDHPNIARLLDGGRTAGGQPYFVMEYVPGRPITEYCDQHDLPIAARIDLLIQACEGVQHAHRNAIIHRDLKPSNVLIVESDGKPTVRIIDFGLAKTVEPAAPQETQVTQFGHFLGTPGYMSPEQLNPAIRIIDTRTDVYSLGVLLYELLAGCLPFDMPEGDSAPFDEWLRRLREEDPRRPSDWVKAGGEQSSRVAASRGLDRKQLMTALRGDLDAITLKALERDRERRYGTAAELHADLRRCLDHEPVLARAPSASYRARKYLRRHWLGAVAMSSAAALLIAFSIAQTVQLHRTRQERDRADRITGFMTQVFKVPDPSEARGSTVTAREILDKSTQEIEAGTGLDPSVQADLLEVMAETNQNLGLYSRAHALALESLNRRRQLFGSDDSKTLESMQQLGTILFLEGHVVEAEKQLRQTLVLESRVLGAKNPQTLKTQDTILNVLVSKGRYAEAERLGREIIPLETQTLGPRDALTLNSMRLLASALRRLNRFDESEALYRKTAALQRLALGSDHPAALRTDFTLANMLTEQGRYAEAEAIYRDTLATRRRILGEDHPDTADTLSTLAVNLIHDPKRNAEAELLYRQALAIEQRQVGPESRLTTRTETGLANLLDAEHRYHEAEDLNREILRVRLKVLGPDNADTLLTQTNLADVVFNEGRTREAEELYRAALAQQTRLLDPNDVDLLNSKANLAEVLLKEGRAAEAEPYAHEAYDALLKVLSVAHRFTLYSLSTYARVLASVGRYDQAKALYVSDLDQISHLPQADASQAWYDFAGVAASANRYDEAFEYLEQAVAHGYQDADALRTDDKLDALHRDARFARLADRVQANAAH